MFLRIEILEISYGKLTSKSTAARERERKRKDSMSKDEIHFVSEEKALNLIKLPSVFSIAIGSS